ncbi:hypothetical protein [Microbulbifer sp. 2205BS26-8]|nr:hypothetical protein [Microbulbifer sp. 2205BS26-8]MDP5210808.1 hypothetical protein [Microbulbifer sp. 2205BS26-8]
MTDVDSSNRVDIDDRQEVVDKRYRIGDWGGERIYSPRIEIPVII